MLATETDPVEIVNNRYRGPDKGAKTYSWRPMPCKCLGRCPSCAIAERSLPNPLRKSIVSEIAACCMVSTYKMRDA